jgi:hypothetical protein
MARSAVDGNCIRPLWPLKAKVRLLSVREIVQVYLRKSQGRKGFGSHSG